MDCTWGHGQGVAWGPVRKCGQRKRVNTRAAGDIPELVPRWLQWEREGGSNTPPALGPWRNCWASSRASQSERGVMLKWEHLFNRYMDCFFQREVRRNFFLWDSLESYKEKYSDFLPVGSHIKGYHERIILSVSNPESHNWLARCSWPIYPAAAFSH